MKEFLFHICSFLLAVVLVSLVFWVWPGTEPTPDIIAISGTQQKTDGFLPNLSKGDQAEIEFISSIQSPEQLTIFGSSEFSSSEYCPFNFLPAKYGIPVLGIGHAHHQELSILGELLAADEYVENSKISIIISPGWFNSSGTNSKAFIEFMRPNFLKRIATSSSIDSKYKLKFGKYIHENYSEFNGVSYEMDVLRDLYLQKEGFVFQQVISSLRTGLRNKFGHVYSLDTVGYETQLIEVPAFKELSDLTSIGDSLKNLFLDGISNNDLFVYDEYYAKYLVRKDGSVKSGSFKSISLDDNSEFSDFKLLVNYLDEKSVDCSFIILPLNPHYYEGMNHGQLLVNELVKVLDSKGMPYLNLFTQAKEEYEPGILRDVMHVGDYGWIKINQFLLDNYYE
ncbi:MAG: D-alanyl-lipoteichoic acid biosynthesis protein DltD [Flavobacteriales bacterium]